MAVPECVSTFHRIQKQIYDTSQLWYTDPYLELRGVATDNAADVAEIFEETHHHFHDALLLVEIVVLQLGALGLQRVHCRLKWKHSTSIWHSSVNCFFKVDFLPEKLLLIFYRGQYGVRGGLQNGKITGPELSPPPPPPPSRQGKTVQPPTLPF